MRTMIIAAMFLAGCYSDAQIQEGMERYKQMVQETTGCPNLTLLSIADLEPGGTHYQGCGRRFRCLQQGGTLTCAPTAWRDYSAMRKNEQIGTKEQNIKIEDE